MTCPGESEFARAVADGADPAMEAHLATCPACREAWEATRRAIDLARELPAAIPSHERREEIRTAVLAAAASVTRRPARRAWLAPAIAAAAAAGLIGYLAFPRGSSVPPGPAGASASQSSPGSSVARHAHGTVYPHPRARYLAISPGPDEVVQLADGAIDVEVEPLHPGERFRVVVGGAEVEVRGTLFTVTAREDHLVGVTVTRGRVEVRPLHGAPAVLGAGQSWHAAPEAMTSATAEPAAAGASVAGLASSPASASGRSSAPSPRAAALVPSSPKHPPATPPRRAATLAPPRVAEPAGTTGSSSSPSRSVSEPRSATPPVQPSAGTARPPEELLYDQAWEALRANDFAKAASGFARVLLLAPESPLVEDASFWHAVALARGKRGAEALSAFRDFLDTYARSSRAGEANAMLGWILIDARMYDEAARRFRAAAGDPSAAVRGSARAGLDALATRTR